MSVRMPSEADPPYNTNQGILATVDWADLVTLDLSKFDQPGGKQDLAAQLFDAVNRIGQYSVHPLLSL